MVRAPEPAPASRTRAPGKMFAFGEDLGGVFGVDDGGAAGHGEDVVDEEVPEAEVFGALFAFNDGSFVAPMMSLWLSDAFVGGEFGVWLEGDGEVAAFWGR